MNGHFFLAPGMLHLLWLLPVLLGFLCYGFAMKDRALARFANPKILKRLTPVASRGRQWLKAVLVLVAVLSAIVSLARPCGTAGPGKAYNRGGDVVFLLDVSRSMLARDAAPDRLGRAKLIIRRLLERLDGYRVALVAFAGAPVVKCPLTLDYGFFELALTDADPDSVSPGGTLIGDAVRKAVDEVFADEENRCRDIVLFSDGEDRDSAPVVAAEGARRKGIRIFTVGLGDEKEGDRIPVLNEQGMPSYLTYLGREVWSRLDSPLLRKIAEATPGGRYLAGGEEDLITEDLRGEIMQADGAVSEVRSPRRVEENFQIFLAISLFFLLLEMSVGERAGNGSKSGAQSRQ